MKKRILLVCGISLVLISCASVQFATSLESASRAGLFGTGALIGDTKCLNAWSSFQDLGSGVSASFCAINAQMHGKPGEKIEYTWRFKNDGTTTITHMDYYVNGNGEGQSEILKTFPGLLAAGAVFGDFSAFRVKSLGLPVIKINKVDRK